MKTITKRFSLILVSVLLVAMTIAMIGCGKKDAAVPASGSAVIELGEGSKALDFSYLDADGNGKNYLIHTDAETVGAALLEQKLIDGEISDWGIYVKSVDGITADYDVDGTYWAFYIDGNYASTGVDATELTEGSKYLFKVE